MPSFPNSTQVLVVGGGPAGTSTAWHLAAAGLDVVLVDRARFPRAKPCAEYVSPEGARILHAMGALELLEQAQSTTPSTSGTALPSAALTGMQVHAPSGEVIRGEFIAQHGFRGFRDRGLGVRREVLDTLLLQRVCGAGVRVVEQAKVETLLQDDNGTVIGARMRAHGAMHDIRATLVVGADGLRSIVARRLGLARTSRWPKRIALVAHYRNVEGIGSLGEMHVTRDGYVGLAGVGDGLTNVALVVPTSRAVAMSGDAAAFLAQWLAQHPGLRERFAQAIRVTPVRVTGPFASRARRSWSDGALLVGDAADFYDPFTGEGIYAALRGGELAAPFVVDAVRALELGAHASRRHRARKALRGYESARHATFAGKWRVEKLIGAAVAMPWLMNYAARVLSRDRDLADLLVGVTGDFVPPSAVLSPRMLLRFLVPRRSTHASTSPVLHAHRQ